MPMSVSAAEMAATASPSEAPGARLKLSVTAGNCSSCMTASGAVVRSTVATVLSGTRLTEAVGRIGRFEVALESVGCAVVAPAGR